MGFRSKMMTQDYGGTQIPGWFLGKHPTLHYGWSGYKACMSIASRTERKFYGILRDEEVFKDLQQVLRESEYTGTLSVVLLHECGGVTLVFVTQESIRAREPVTWKEVENVEHDYCYGCSEPPTTKE